MFAAAARPGRASGDTVSGHLIVTGEYAIDAVPGFAVRANFAGALFGPGSIWFGAGARYAFPIVPTIRLFAGPELELGLFIPTGGDKEVRFLLHPSAFVSIGFGPNVQVELSPDFPIALGGTGTLVLAGGTVRGLFRF
jgi:hypothetical protein